MPIPPLLAHGALGAFDEIIFLGFAVIFLVMMGVSWIVSRNARLRDAELPAQTSDAESPDRFPLS